jgi:hypothetical protein
MPVKGVIDRLVDDAHATPSDLPENPVIRKRIEGIKGAWFLAEAGEELQIPQEFRRQVWIGGANFLRINVLPCAQAISQGPKDVCESDLPL